MSSSRPIRIAGASGSASDRRHALASFARNFPEDPVDVVICDYLSEANMATTAAKRHGASQAKGGTSPAAILPAYETPFLEALEPALEDLATHRIKVVANAGASDTEALYEVVKRMVERRGLNIPVARVSGDEVLSTILSHIKPGNQDYQNIYTSESLSAWASKYTPIFAQAYLGGMGIAEAFSQGAQIVICGRVSDASPVIGAAYWWHGWKRTQLRELANALVAGHLIECSTYVTGGNFSGFTSLEKSGWEDIGFPIAELANDGCVVITKQKTGGGVVSTDTCSSQVLYEIQGPYYFNSDVTAVLTDLWFEQVGQNRVQLHGVTGLPPPPTTKVGITALGGYQAEACWFLTGLRIDEKAKMLEAQLRRNLIPYSNNFTTLSFSVLGSAQSDADNQNAATVIFRVFVQARNSHDIIPQKFLRPLMDNIMQGYPGATFHLDFRQGIPKPYHEYFVTTISQSAIEHCVHFSGRETNIPAPSQTQVYNPRQPDQAEPALKTDLSKFGPCQRLPLGTIVHARSGDKGSDCNCGFWVRHADEYTWLRNLLTTDKIKELLGREHDTTRTPAIQIERFELPSLRGVHFLFRNLLDRGVNSTSSVDFLGKNCAEFLRSRHVDLPARFLNRGRL